MKRRSFLVGGVALGASQWLTGCAQNPVSLSVRSLKRSIPAQLPGKFRKTLPRSAAFSVEAEAQIADIFRLLQRWNNPQASQRRRWLPIPSFRGNADQPAQATLVTLGDAWLQPAIQQGLIQPLQPEAWQNWASIPEAWRRISQRNEQGLVSPAGSVWGAPYRWGTTVIAYRKDKFERNGLRPPQDWADLWQPGLQGRLSLLDQEREVIGLVLKKLGQSYNVADPTAVTGLVEEARSLHQQVKFYSSTAYLEPLLLGDTWAAVGWSTDVLPLLESQRHLAVVVPQSGTALWADLWVQAAAPASEAVRDLMNEWIDFCWNPAIAGQFSLVSRAVSPIVPSLDRSTLPQSLQDNSILLPPPEVLERCEFLEPLPEAATQTYAQLWRSLRTA